MDFFRNQWAPARSVRPDFQFKTPERRSPRVVQIPVHFVRSELSRSASALKIQKVFRGYLVRRSVRKIAAIKREVDAIEARVSRREVADLIKKNEKERLKVNESLMSLLLKLDAVGGGAVDSGVRVCRKAVIKKAIALQEKVDSLCTDLNPETAEKSDAVAVNDNGHDQKHETINEPEEKALNSEEPQSISIVCDKMEDDSGECSSDEEFESPEQNVDEKNGKRDSELGRDEQSCSVDCLMEEVEADEDPAVNEFVVVDMPEQETNETKDGGKNEKIEVNEEGKCAQAEYTEEKMEQDDEADNGAGIEEGIDAAVAEKGVDGNDKEKTGGHVGGDDKKNEINQLMEKIVEDNGKMMQMMSGLFERTEAQAKMLNTLTLRLEQLEKAFLCDKIRRKKKRQCS
ncbi:OLC1v1028561C1 [Oldenlandia corymbosa var. corymbosa]|uniref:OLC1v1028561C1 n=1 Tax=Oldenlandia corymbosa var. corymbosa TaxID=529605 RepID=A0AAV1CCH8_OLDCO|nr:OLC1v1028561C1 [Oldenlandia corymbosa var. corymbosa]